MRTGGATARGSIRKTGGASASRLQLSQAPRLGQLAPDREPADTFAGRGKNRIAQRRREGWHARLADSAGMHADRVVDDVDAGFPRRLVDPRDLEVVEVTLLHATVLERDFAVLGERQAHHGCAL